MTIMVQHTDKFVHHLIVCHLIYSVWYTHHNRTCHFNKRVEFGVIIHLCCGSLQRLADPLNVYFNVPAD